MADPTAVSVSNLTMNANIKLINVQKITARVKLISMGSYPDTRIKIHYDLASIEIWPAFALAPNYDS